MPIDFKKRSCEAELLDADGIPFEDIRRNMEELDVINSYMGGHSVTLFGFKSLLGKRKEVSVCEIGCGGGDNLRALQRWCMKNNVAIRCIGIDIKEECIAFAKMRDMGGDIDWLVSDYRDVDFGGSFPDIVFSSLFCHHFTDEQLVGQLQWMRANCRVGFFINDLHRHWLAYYSIKVITGLFSSSYLVRNDAPLSVLRGFVRRDWEVIFERAQIGGYGVRWVWAFRFLVISS